MANQNSNATISEQVRQHGEMLARLTTIVENLERKTDKQEESIDLIAKAVARRETRDEFKARLLNIGVPLATALLSGLAGHFWFH